MRFGLQIGSEDWSRLRDTAQAAEALRFDALYLPDHLDECIAELRRRKTEWGLAETIFHCEPSVLRRLGEQVLPHV